MADTQLTDEEIGRCIREHRSALLPVHLTDLIIALQMSQSAESGLYLSGSNLPPAAYPKEAFYDPCRTELMVRVLHPSFDPVLPGCYEPLLECGNILRRNTAGAEVAGSTPR